MNCFITYSNTTTGNWKRHKLNEREVIIERIKAIKELSEQSKNDLILLAQMLQYIPADVMEYLKKRKNLRITTLSVNGLNYSLGLFSRYINSIQNPLKNHNEIYLVVQPKMFSSIGGAGLPYIYNRPVIKLNRNSFPYSGEQIRLREKFQKLFISYIDETK